MVVAGAQVVGGYLHGVGDAATKIRAAGRIWHRTGDLGRVDELGRLWLLGRAAAAVLDAEGAMYPFAVECALRECFGLTEVVALAADGRRTLVLGGNFEGVTDSDIRESVPWARIAHIKRIDTIPMDTRHNSKVDYAELRRRIHSTG